jgi:hypothetical protein
MGADDDAHEETDSCVIVVDCRGPVVVALNWLLQLLLVAADIGKSSSTCPLAFWKVIDYDCRLTFGRLNRGLLRWSSLKGLNDK